MTTLKLHPDIEMGEVKLKVSKLDRSIAFYEEILGFRTLSKQGTIAELGAEEGKTLLILEEVADAVYIPPNRTSGLYHFAVLLPTRRDLGTVLRHMADKGIEIGQADHAVSEALYISDPDNNGIEIYRDRPRDEWTYEANGNVHMVTEPIDWRGLLAEAEGHEWRGLPSGTKIGHVHLHVSDLVSSKEFYIDQFGFDVMLNGERFMGALFVAAGGYHHHLGLNIWSGRGAPRRPENATGLAYYTIVFPEQAALDSTLDQLRAHNLDVQQQGSDWFVEDPSGNKIKLRIAS